MESFQEMIGFFSASTLSFKNSKVVFVGPSLWFDWFVFHFNLERSWVILNLTALDSNEQEKSWSIKKDTINIWNWKKMLWLATSVFKTGPTTRSLTTPTSQSMTDFQLLERCPIQWNTIYPYSTPLNLVKPSKIPEKKQLNPVKFLKNPVKSSKTK